MKKTIVLSIAAILAFSCTKEQPAAVDNQSSEISIRPDFANRKGVQHGEFAVKFNVEPKDSASAASMVEGLAVSSITRMFPPAGKWEERHRKAGLHLWYIVSFDPEAAVATKALTSLKDSRFIDKMEEIYTPVSTARPCCPFNDPMAGKQWHYCNTTSNSYSVPGCDIKLYEAWTICTGRKDVIVAVIDQGVDYLHEDLKENMWLNPGEIPGNNKDDDNNGFVDDIYGVDFRTTNYGKPVQPGEHGTHVAGTISAVNNNGTGLCGIAGGDGSGNGVRIMTCQILNGNSYAQNAMVYAADNGAVITNNSWGYTMDSGATSTSSYLKDAINYFNKNAGFDEHGNQVGPMAGGLTIFAAGNDERQTNFPSSIDADVWSVAAIGADFTAAWYTNYGTWVSICAPGGTQYGSNYVWSTSYQSGKHDIYAGDGFQGTSMAAPHVSGVAALAVSLCGKQGFTNEMLKKMILDGANTDIYKYNSSKFQNKLGKGMLDAYATLGMYGPEPPSKVDSKTIKYAVKYNTVNVSWTVPADPDNGKAYYFDIYYSKDDLSGLDVEHLPSGVTKISEYATEAAGATHSTKIESLDFNTRYYVRIDAKDMSGNASGLCDQTYFKTAENNPPVIKALDGTSVKVKQYETKKIRFEASDTEGQNLSGESTDNCPALSYLWDGTKLLTVTVDGNGAEAGTWTETVTVSDGIDKTTMDYTVEIIQNIGPTSVGSIPDMIFDKKTTKTIDLDEYFEDENEDKLSYEITYMKGNKYVKAIILDDHLLRLSSSDFGQSEYIITASDPLNKKAEQRIRAMYRDSHSGNGNPTADLYPNPVADKLNIRTTDSVTASLNLYSSTGVLVMSTEDFQASAFKPATIDMSSISAGTYKAVLSVKGSTGFEYSETIVKL